MTQELNLNIMIINLIFFSEKTIHVYIKCFWKILLTFIGWTRQAMG
jgi:hypothetical protein